jgi:hypothetical protein
MLHFGPSANQVTNSTNHYFGSNDTWHFVPYSAFSFRKSVLLNPHNLATETFVNSLQVLTWSFAMGYQLAYDLNWVRDSLVGAVITEHSMSACSPRSSFLLLNKRTHGVASSPRQSNKIPVSILGSGPPWGSRTSSSVPILTSRS